MTHVFNERTKIKGVVDTGADVVSDAMSVVDLRAIDLLEQMLSTLKKIEYHLMLASDADLENQEV